VDGESKWGDARRWWEEVNRRAFGCEGWMSGGLWCGMGNDYSDEVLMTGF